MGVKKVLAIVLAVGFVGVGSASAGNSPTNTVYGNAGKKAVTATVVVKAKASQSTSAKPSASVATTDQLPFTGADLSIAVIGGIALLATGYSLRRVSRRQKD